MRESGFVRIHNPLCYKACAYKCRCRITLSGEAEIGLGDGTIHRLGSGDVHMAEDLTGHGHTTRVVGQGPRVTATMHLEG